MNSSGRPPGETLSGSGGIGRHARLRIWCRKVWGFKSPLPQSYHTLHHQQVLHACTTRLYYSLVLHAGKNPVIVGSVAHGARQEPSSHLMGS